MRAHNEKEIVVFQWLVGGADFCTLFLLSGTRAWGRKKRNWSLDSLFLLALSLPWSKPQPHPLSSFLFFLQEVLTFLVAKGLVKAGNIVYTCPEVRHIIKASTRRAAFSSYLGRSPLFLSSVETCLAPLGWLWSASISDVVWSTETIGTVIFVWGNESVFSFYSSCTSVSGGKGVFQVL